MFDLILRGGRVLDPGRGTDVTLDVASAGGRVAGEANALPALEMARRIADDTGKRIMVHVSGTPITLETILERLCPGDVATHIFNGYEHGILDDKGRVRAVVREAVARGVVLDVGHAGVHFDVNVARAALELNLPPTTLSTDLVRPFVPRRTYDLLGVMSTFLALGMPLHGIIKSVTDAPPRPSAALTSWAPWPRAPRATPQSSSWKKATTRSATPPATKSRAVSSSPVLTVRAGHRWRPR